MNSEINKITSSTKKFIQKLMSENQSKTEFILQLITESMELQERVSMLHVEHSVREDQSVPEFLKRGPGNALVFSKEDILPDFRWVKFSEREPTEDGFYLLEFNPFGFNRSVWSLRDIKKSEFLKNNMVAWLKIPERRD